MRNFINIMETVSSSAWGGGWIKPTGEMIKVVNPDTDETEDDHPLHHSDLLDDDFPDVYDLHDSAIENGETDDHDFPEFAIEHALKAGWMHVDTFGSRLSVQFTAPQRPRALATLQNYVSDHNFTTFAIDTSENAHGDPRTSRKFTNAEEFFRVLNHLQAGLRGA